MPQVLFRREKLQEEIKKFLFSKAVYTEKLLYSKDVKFIEKNYKCLTLVKVSLKNHRGQYLYKIEKPRIYRSF